MTIDTAPVFVCRNCFGTLTDQDSAECCNSPDLYAAKKSAERASPARLFTEIISAGPGFDFRLFLIDSTGELYFKKSYSAEDEAQKIPTIPVEKFTSDELAAICLSCGRIVKSASIFKEFFGGRPGFKSLNFCGGSEGCKSSKIAIFGPKFPPLIFADKIKSLSVDQISGVAYALTISGRIYKIKPYSKGLKISDDRGNEIFHKTTNDEISKV
jgi:hypothetical protein